MSSSSWRLRASVEGLPKRALWALKSPRTMPDRAPKKREQGQGEGREGLNIGVAARFGQW